MYIYNLAQKFKSVAAKFPNNVALICGEQSITYEQLDAQTDSLACFLLASGLQREDVICISGQKTVLSLVCIIGAVKAGVAYSVFDPVSPVARLGKIFETCQPKMVLCAAGLAQQLAHAGFSVVNYDQIQLHENRPERLSRLFERMRTVAGSSPAYIMFTSGSTGFPKGATMTNQNVLNLIEWSLETYGFSSDDVLTSINPLFFDNSVFDIYSSLFCGASLALFDSDTVREPQKLMRLIDEFKCTSWFSVPSMLIYLQTVRALNASSLKHIKRIIFGGEGYPKGKLKELFDMFANRINFYNVYGPTECTCICSSYLATEHDFHDLKGFLPLGHLAPNFEDLIVDDELRSVPDGHPGELILRGPNVGLGYYRDAERTAASFIQNPTHNSFRDICYRTGDIVFKDPGDHRIWISGRADNQIKHMGYRIELEEIENAISCVESVGQSAVIHCEVRGLSQIVAFIMVKEAGLNEENLRERLTKMIPLYMVPTRFQFVDQLPKNANGKLDRKRLKKAYAEQLLNG